MLCAKWFFLFLTPIAVILAIPLDWNMLIEFEIGHHVDACIHGVCKPFSNGSCECYCQNGFTGYKCETNFDDCVSTPCRNGATCIDQVAGFICVCPEGFSGFACETVVNHCHSRPCLNGGVCQDFENGFACLCNVGFTGQNCEVDVEVCNSVDFQEVQCFNGGTCVEGVGISFTCSCPHGFEGPRCEEDVDECLSQPCFNNGTCVDGFDGFICICPYSESTEQPFPKVARQFINYRGLLCEEVQSVCSSELCSRRGLCLGNETHYKCFCVPDYHGVRCQWRYNECLPEPRCLHGGTCIDHVDTFTCVCPPHFVGPRCETRCNVLCDTQHEPDASSLTSHSCSVRSVSFESSTVSLWLSEVNNITATFSSAQLYNSSLISAEIITMSTDFETIFMTSSKLVSGHDDDVHLLVSSNVPLSSSFSCSSSSSCSSAPESLEVVELSASIVSEVEEDQHVTTTVIATSMIVIEKTIFFSSRTNVIDSSSSSSLTLIDVFNSFSWWPSSVTSRSNASVELLPTVGNSEMTSLMNSTIFEIITQSALTFTDFSTLFNSSIEFAQLFTTTAPFTPTKMLSPSSVFWTVLSISGSISDMTIELSSLRNSEESLEYSSSLSSEPNIPKTISFVTDKTITVNDTIKEETAAPPTENILQTWNENTILLTSYYYEHFISVFSSDVEFSDTVIELTPTKEKETAATSTVVFFTASSSFDSSSMSSPLMTTSTTTTRTFLQSSNILETTWVGEDTVLQTPELLTLVFSVTSKDITSDASVTTSIMETDKFYPFSRIISQSSSSAVGLMPSFSSKTVDIITMLSLETLDISSHQIHKSCCDDRSDIIDRYETSSLSMSYKSDRVVESTIDFSEEFGSGSGVGDTLLTASDHDYYWVSVLPSAKQIRHSVATTVVSDLSPSYDVLYFNSFSSVIDDQSSGNFNTLDTSIYWPIMISDYEDEEGTTALEMSSFLVPTLTFSPLPLSSPLFPSPTSPYPMTSQIVSPTNDVNQSVGRNSLGCSGVICQNGGTCYAYEYPKESLVFTCLCLLNFTGVYCDEVLPKIDIPAFDRFSWLSYDVFNGSSRDSIQIRMTFKTLAETGILFHADFSNLSYNCDDTFLLLQVDNGFPILIFSCGSRSVVSMEEMIRVDDGQQHDLFVGIEWYKNVDHHGVCNISMQLDHWPSITGQQHDVKQSCFATKLYIGRSSHSIRNQNEISYRDGGFRGCVLKLQVNDQLINLISDASEGVSIGNCDDVLCTMYNCHHGGMCKILQVLDAMCYCPSGYCGQFCERKCCDQQQCHNGGTCLTVNQNDYVCLCPYGYNGLNCDQVSDMSEVTFFGTYLGYSSFVAYQLNQFEMKHFAIKLEFTVNDPQNLNDGLLIFLGQSGMHIWNSKFFAVGLYNGFVTLQFNIGSGVQMLTSKIVAKNEIDGDLPLYFVSFGFDRHLVWLQTNEQPNVSCPLQWPTSSEQNVQKMTSLLYIGGHESYNFTFLPSALLFRSGFSGCISNIRINTGNMSGYRFLEKPLYGRNVKQCDTNNCVRNNCRNGGTCKDLGATFMCECRSGWFGPLCSHSFHPCEKRVNKCSPWSTCVVTEDSSACDCPLGWEGTHCDREMNITDASFNGINSYMSFVPQNIRYFMKIRLEIQVRRRDGVLVYAARYLSKRSDDFLCISLNDGYVEFRYNFGRSPQDTIVLRSPYKINVDDDDFGWHVIEAHREANRGFLEIDSKYRVTDTSSSGMVLMDTTTDFFLGGLPDMSLISPMATEKVPTTFDGCVRYFAVNDQHYNIGVDAKRGRNVVDCDGTACGHEVCLNGGTCVPLGSLDYRCVCTPFFTGSHCADALPCQSHLCQNGAKCIPASNSDYLKYICDCPLGWKGQHCDEVSKISSAYFKGDGYITIVDDDYPTSDRSKSRISFAFKSRIDDGLILWTGREHNNDEDFLGLGLRKGQLKVVWNLGWFSQGCLITSKIQTLADSRWHAVTLVRRGNKLSLDVDGTVYVYTTPGSYDELNTLGIYYLGGFPRNANVSSWTNDNFQAGYTGCLRNVTLSVFKRNVDFMDGYDGCNVFECHSDIHDKVENVEMRNP